MRIPVSKIYRAFPELDRFGDQQCEGFVSQAGKRLTGLRTLAGLGQGAVFLTITGGWMAAMMPLVDRLEGFRGGAGVLATLIWIVLILLGPLCGAVPALMIRDAWLRRAIASLLVDTRCGRCRYSLLGLGVSGGEVRCPECGLVLVLASRGLQPVDLIAGADPDAKLAR